MRTWWLVAGAIATEVTGTMSLAGAMDRPWLYAVTAVGELASFYLLIKVLQAGMPLGVAYGVWSALGVAATAVLSSIFLDEVFTGAMVARTGADRGRRRPGRGGSHPVEREPA